MAPSHTVTADVTHRKPSAAINPWLPSPSGEPDEPAGAQPPAVLVPPPASGPTAPQAGVPAPDRGDRLPRRDVAVTARLWWVGAHGGAGESTLAALLPQSRAAGHAWPVASAPVRAVLVARTTMRGLRAAQVAAADWASGGVAGVELLGLVLIADAPTNLSRPLRELATVVAGGVPRVWRVPWHEPWRAGADPGQSSPRQARRLVDDLRALTPDPRSQGGPPCPAC